MTTFKILMAVKCILRTFATCNSYFSYYISTLLLHQSMSSVIMHKNKYKSSHCCSSIAINYEYWFFNNQCLLVVFTTALLLPFHPLINFIPMQYWKQLHLHLRAIAYTTIDTLHKLLFQYYFRLGDMAQMPTHISLAGVDPGIFIGGSKVWFRQDCWTFLWQITSHNSDDHVFLNLWTSVAIGAGNTILLCSRGKQIVGRYPKTITFLNIPEI